MATETTQPRDPVLHVLKTWPGPFEAVANGTKPFEVRPDDRGYQPGDLVILREFIPEHLLEDERAERETNRVEAGPQTRAVGPFRIGYLLRGAPLPAGWCAFTLIYLVPATPTKDPR